MCGIVGFTGYSNECHYLRQMNDAQSHRGPDDIGQFYSDVGNIHLGMSRLSIIDISGGGQPMLTDDERFCVVFNGEIFNSTDLRYELIRRGVIFRTDHSDTEVLLYMYAIYGKDMLEKLNGMFAFAIFDKNTNSLFCARDRFGIKPFYYSFDGGRFSFASEIKSLKCLPWISKDLNKQSIYHYFSFQSIPSPNSIFSSINKLSSAHWLELDLSNSSIKSNSFWRPSYSDKLPCNVNELPDYVLSSLTAAVRRWSISDVPFACSLSGGIDSSAIVGILSQCNESPIKTYTLGFGDHPKLDEREAARLISDKYLTDHHEIILSVDELKLDLDDMIFHLDEPYAGGLPSWSVFKEMSLNVKVGISGTGGDELFGNYGKLDAYKKVFQSVRSIYNFLINGGSTRDLLSNPYASLYHPNYFPDRYKKQSLFSDTFVNCVEYSSIDLIESLWDYSLSIGESISKIDFALQLPEEFLLMTDRFSMAHSLEVRTPFLDSDFVNDILRIPYEYRYDGRGLKKLLKSSMDGIIPEAVLNSKKKGFVIPEKDWLMSSFRKELMDFSSPDFIERQGIFSHNIRGNFINPFLSGKTGNYKQVWTWFMFQKFYKLNYVDSR